MEGGTAECAFVPQIAALIGLGSEAVSIKPPMPVDDIADDLPDRKNDSNKKAA